MVKRCTTRGAAKRPGPVVLDNDDCKNMDVEKRREKVQVLIKDFQTEMAARKNNLRIMLDSALNRVDLAYSMGICALPSKLRKMKIVDVLGQGAQSKAEEEEIPDIPEMTEADIKQTAKQRGRKRGSRMKGSATAAHMVTPGNSTNILSQWNTPVITPKFDPRLFYTTAAGGKTAGGAKHETKGKIEEAAGAAAGSLSVTRAAKSGELLVSMDGSPIIINHDKPVVGGKFMMVPMDQELSLEGLDSDSLQGMFGAAEKLYESLKAVCNYPTSHK